MTGCQDCCRVAPDSSNHGRSCPGGGIAGHHLDRHLHDGAPFPLAIDPPGAKLRGPPLALTGEDLRKAGRWGEARDPYLLETSVPGIFACGDVRFSPVKRVAAAVGEGSMAIAFVHQYLRDEAAEPAT